MLDPHLTNRLEDHPFSADRNCLFRTLRYLPYLEASEKSYILPTRRIYAFCLCVSEQIAAVHNLVGCLSFASCFPFAFLLTPWCRVLLEKLTGLQLVKKFPTFYGTRRFITALTSVRHLSLSWASPIKYTYPHPTSWISILILSTHLRLGLSISYRKE